MSTTSQAPPTSGRKDARVARGLRLFHERGHEIIEVEPGTYRVPGSDNAEYTVRLDSAYCSCPDRVSPCKHLYCIEIYAAKKHCRRRRTATDRPERRHGTAAPRPREQQDGTGRGSGPGRHGGIAPGRPRGFGVGREKVLAGLERMGS